MAKFVTIGERLSTTAPAVNKAFMERDPEPILKRAKQQLDAGAVYLDVNIGPADGYGEDLMKWAVQLLQSEFDNVPLALDTSNKAAIEAGISVSVSYTHLRAHETDSYLVCRLMLEKIFFLMIRRPPRSTLSSSSAASDVYKRQLLCRVI